MRELETAVRRSPNDADLLMDLANTEWNLRGSQSQAITRAERAVQLDPRNQRRMVVLAFLYQEGHQFDDAERTYDRAIALRPENAGPYTQKAVNYLIGYGDLAPGARGLAPGGPPCGQHGADQRRGDHPHASALHGRAGRRVPASGSQFAAERLRWRHSLVRAGERCDIPGARRLGPVPSLLRYRTRRREGATRRFQDVLPAGRPRASERSLCRVRESEGGQCPPP